MSAQHLGPERRYSAEIVLSRKRRFMRQIDLRRQTEVKSPEADDFSAENILYYTIAVETIKGQPVTDQDIQDWSDEAERGYDVEQLRRRGRKPVGEGPGQVVPVRIDATLLAALTDRAERDHVSRSEAIRAAIRSYVA